MSEGYLFFSIWDNALAREEPMPWATCPAWDDPARLQPDSCCGQAPIGRCGCGRWVYEKHARHWGRHERHPGFIEGQER